MSNLNNKKIIITGASGGIGEPLVKLLAKEKVELFLLSSNSEKLKKLGEEIEACGSKVNYIEADLASVEGITSAAQKLSQISAPDILINLAGISYFGSLGMQKHQDIAKLYNVNLLAPTLLSQALLAEMVANSSGHIVNIGSIFGSIAFPFFATYSASKAGLRGFSESLRRELMGSGVKVSYIAPRAVKTKINEGKVSEFLKKTKSNIDEAELVAQKIFSILQSQKSYAYFGFPESLFVRVNYLLPKLVDCALKSKGDIAKTILNN